ncbi:MAG TPA: acyl carrier protein [Burkholderiales bacterium]|jgi:acyl carrier protein
METTAEIKQLIHARFGIEAATLRDAAPLAQYGLDSLSLAELVFSIEEHFGIDMPVGRDDINTIDKLALLIDELRTPA